MLNISFEVFHGIFVLLLRGLAGCTEVLGLKHQIELIIPIMSERYKQNQVCPINNEFQCLLQEVEYVMMISH